MDDRSTAISAAEVADDGAEIAAAWLFTACTFITACGRSRSVT